MNGSPYVETVAGVHSGMIYEEAKKFEALLGGQQWLWSKRVEMVFDVQLFHLRQKFLPASLKLVRVVENRLGHTLVAIDLPYLPNLSSPVDQSERTVASKS